MRLPKITSALRTVLYHCSAWGKVQWYTSFLGSWQVWQCQACRSYALYTTQHCIFFPPPPLWCILFVHFVSRFQKKVIGEGLQKSSLSSLLWKKKSFHEIKRRREKFWSLQPRGSRCKHPRRRYTSKPLIKGQFHSCKNARLKCEEYVQRTAKLQIWHQNFWVRALFSDGAYLIKCASLPSIHWNSSPFSLVCEWGILHIHGDHSGDSLEFA